MLRIYKYIGIYINIEVITPIVYNILETKSLESLIKYITNLEKKSSSIKEVSNKYTKDSLITNFLFNIGVTSYIIIYKYLLYNYKEVNKKVY